jgi:hypothetical protein
MGMMTSDVVWQHCCPRGDTIQLDWAVVIITVELDKGDDHIQESRLLETFLIS